MKRNSIFGSFVGFVLLIQLAGSVLYGCLAYWSVNFLLAYFLHKDIPWIGDLVIGLIAGALTIPVAIVMAILQYFGAI